MGIKNLNGKIGFVMVLFISVCLKIVQTNN